MWSISSVFTVMDESGLSTYYRTDGDAERLDNIKELQNSFLIH